MKIKMTVTYGEQFCEDLKEELDCTTDEELLGAFKGMILNELTGANITEKDLSINLEKV